MFLNLDIKYNYTRSQTRTTKRWTSQNVLVINYLFKNLWVIILRFTKTI